MRWCGFSSETHATSNRHLIAPPHHPPQRLLPASLRRLFVAGRRSALASVKAFYCQTASAVARSVQMKGGGGERGEERPNIWRSKGRCSLLSMPPHLFPPRKSSQTLSLQHPKCPATIGHHNSQSPFPPSGLPDGSGTRCARWRSHLLGDNGKL